MLRAREGRSIPEGPYEGVPPHLKSQIEGWLEQQCSKPSGYIESATVNRLGAILRIRLSGAKGYNLFAELLVWADYDNERLLDLAHYAIQIREPSRNRWKDLEVLLALGGSVWRATETGLERRVDPTAMEAFNATTAVADSASDHLKRAWSHAYGRNPDPAAAWQQSIKAAEAALRPRVCPNNMTATLSNVIGELKTGQWRLELRGRDRSHSTEPLVTMLELLWTEPNRHGSPTPEPPATKEEACAVVQLAVAIVQWGRDGQIVKS